MASILGIQVLSVLGRLIVPCTNFLIQQNRDRELSMYDTS